MHSLPVNKHSVVFLGKRTEFAYVFADELRHEIFLYERNKIACEEQGVASARARILNRRAIAVADGAVLENELNRDGFAGLTNARKAFGNRFAHVHETIVSGARFDCSLVVEIETGVRFC